MSEEINEMLDVLLDDFRLILNKYIILLEKDCDYRNTQVWKQAMSVYNKYFTI